MHDPMQTVFDGAEAIALVLHEQAGLEMALFEILDPVLAGDKRLAQMVYAIVDGMAQFRGKAEQAAHEMMTISFDR